jgi:hypothetical protein
MSEPNNGQLSCAEAHLSVTRQLDACFSHPVRRRTCTSLTIQRHHQGFLSRHAWGIVWASSRSESSFSMAPPGAWLVRWCRVRQARTAVRAQFTRRRRQTAAARRSSMDAHPGSHTCRCLLKSTCRAEPRIRFDQDSGSLQDRARMHVLLQIKNPSMSLLPLHRTPLDRSANYQCCQARIRPAIGPGRTLICSDLRLDAYVIKGIRYR